MLTIASTGGTEPTAPSPLFPRLRALALSNDLNEAQRARIRATIPAALDKLCASMHLAIDACDGPDPEMALLYAIDAACSVVAEFTTLDASLT